MIEEMYGGGTGAAPWEKECIARLKFQIFNMLVPLNPHDPASGQALYPDLSADDLREPENLHNDPLFDHLNTIVLAAVQVHTNIRRSHDRIFYWDPVYTGSEFEPESATCANLGPVSKTSPFTVKVGKDGNKFATIEGEAGFHNGTKALVRVVSFHGLTVYRKGGGELADYLLEVEKDPGYFKAGGAGFDRWRRLTVSRSPKDITRDNGFRSRIMAKGIVALTWGKERRMVPLSRVANSPEEEDDDDNGDGQVELLDMARNEVMEMQKEGKEDGGCVMS